MKMYEQRGHDSNKGDIFAYDGIYRLTGLKFNSPEPANPASEQFEKHKAVTFDRLSNILSIDETINGQSQTITTNIPADSTYSKLNQYERFDRWGLSYDLNGNLTQKSTQHNVYDYQNRIVRATDVDSTVNFKYDPLGRRIQKEVTIGSQIKTTNFYYSGHQVIEERDGSDQVTRQFIYGNGIDEVMRVDIYTGTTSTPYYFHINDIGSITAITDANGNIIERVYYDIYGKPVFKDAAGNVIHRSSIGNNILFQGREYDTELNLYYFRARYYDPIMGRFLSIDPMGYHDSMNLYQAFNMNPLNFVDPLGEYKLLIRDNKAFVVTELGEVFEDIVRDLGENFGEKELRIIDQYNKFNYSPRHIFHEGDEIAMPKNIFPDITADLIEKMRRNAKNIWIHNPFYFRKKVRAGGDWDFKSQKGTIYESEKFKFYFFKDRLIRYDAPGNIHYGYVGKAAIWSSDILLYKKAGEVQTYKEPGWNVPPYYGDDPVDHLYIKWGIELYNEDRISHSKNSENLIKKFEVGIKWYYLNRFYKEVYNR